MAGNQIFEEEKEHLAETLDKFGEIIRETRESFDRMPWLYSADTDVMNEMLTQLHNRVARLRQSADKPYFARIDFAEKEEPFQKLYIGKIGVQDDADNLVTLDWRSPVATLYYDSSVGPVTYEAPGGMVEGELSLKRQLEVEEGELLSVRDVDLVSDDELLRPYLGVSADNRLKNIIATIQGEQNRIIREKINRDLIVQGAAGSGKTTVALHRIAYLVYTYRDAIRPEQYLVIGPNRFFINYISSVLPDLDVDSVPQYTYEDLARSLIGEKYGLTDPAKRLAAAVGGTDDSGVEAYKLSLPYRDALDRFLKDFTPTILPEGDFMLEDFTVIEEDAIRTAWEDAMAGPGDDILTKVEHAIIYLRPLIEYSPVLLEQKVDQHFREKMRAGGDIIALQKRRAAIEKELRAHCAKSMRAFFGRVDTPLLALYREFTESCEQWLDPSFSKAEELKARTLKNLRGRKLDPEDQAALLHLRTRIRGRRNIPEYRHAVIDEGQDFGVFDYCALRESLPDCNFTVVGDLAQSIYTYRGTADWEQVRREAFGGKAEIEYLQKSYRNTVEIMEAANRVSGLLGIPPATPVIRHGEPVRLWEIKAKELAGRVGELLRDYKEQGYQSVALLGKTDKEAAAIQKALGGEVQLITGESTVYAGGTCAMPCHLAKGLEFDCVVLLDAGENQYSAARTIDMHLLYVAMTRPLHRLDIFSAGEPSLPLRELNTKK